MKILFDTNVVLDVLLDRRPFSVIGAAKALAAVRRLLSLFTVAQVDGRTLLLATEIPLVDFEDAVLHESARLAGATMIVTRNGADFRQGSLTVRSPDELEAALSEKG